MKKPSWYQQWHSHWIHGPSHWLILACAIATASALITYSIRSGEGSGLVPETNAQVTAAAATQISTCRADGCTLTIPRYKMFMSATNPNTIWAMFERSSANLMKSTDGGLNWGAGITVRSYLDYHSSLDGDSLGNLYVTDPGSGNVYFRKINAPAASATDMQTPLTLTSAFIPAGVATRSNVLVQDSNNIWVFYRTSSSAVGNVRYFHSTNGGATFSNEGWVSNTSSDNVRVGSFLINGVPAVVIKYVTRPAGDPIDYRYFIWNGSSFVRPADSDIVVNEISVLQNREFSMSYVDGELHLVYNNGALLRHAWKAYNNGTGTWNHSTITSLAYSPRDWHPSFTRHGNDLYVFYIKQETSTVGNNNVYYRKWDTTAHTWSSATALTSDGADNRFPGGPAVVNPDATYIPAIWSAATAVVKYDRIATAAAPCSESWSCTAWSACSQGGTQTRTCTDQNACGTTTSKPAESQSCTPGDTTPPTAVSDLYAH
jgi:hypothetical protein